MTTGPPFRTGIACRCPRCGQGRLFEGFLSLAPACRSCGLDNSMFDPADGPAVFIILFAGFLVVAGALMVEIAWQPPYWLHFALWIPAALALPLVMLRPFKGVLIALQFRHKAAEGRLSNAGCNFKVDPVEADNLTAAQKIYTCQVRGINDGIR